MAEPRTEAGRRLSERFRPPDDADPRDESVATAWARWSALEEDILAIEAEARAQGALHEHLLGEGEMEARVAEARRATLEALRAEVEGMPTDPMVRCPDCDAPNRPGIGNRKQEACIDHRAVLEAIDRLRSGA